MARNHQPTRAKVYGRRTIVRKTHQISLPRDLMKDLDLEDGDPLSVIGWAGVVILMPEAELEAPVEGVVRGRIGSPGPSSPRVGRRSGRTKRP